MGTAVAVEVDVGVAVEVDMGDSLIKRGIDVVSGVGLISGVAEGVASKAGASDAWMIKVLVNVWSIPFSSL